MSSESVRSRAPSPRRLRHSAELPFFVFMVLLNVLIVAAVLEAAAVRPILPDRLQASGWAVAVRAAWISLLPLGPVLVLVRVIQRASIRGTAVQLSPSQYPELCRTAEDLALRYVVRSNELFANLENGNRDGLRFILGHEMGHIRLHHVSLWYQLAVAAQLPRSHPFTVRRLERPYNIGLFRAHVQATETRV